MYSKAGGGGEKMEEEEEEEEQIFKQEEVIEWLSKADSADDQSEEIYH